MDNLHFNPMLTQCLKASQGLDKKGIQFLVEKSKYWYITKVYKENEQPVVFIWVLKTQYIYFLS